MITSFFIIPSRITSKESTFTRSETLSLITGVALISIVIKGCIIKSLSSIALVELELT